MKLTGSDMFFLLRTAFWLTLVLALIPLGSGQESTATEKVDPVSAFLAAQAAVSDIGGFCSRNPQACETGGDALSAIGSSARDGARIVYDFLDTKMSEDGDAAPLITGSTPIQTPADAVSGTFPAATGVEEVSSPETAVGPVPRSKPGLGVKT